MQKISYKDMPKISRVTSGVSRYRQTARVKPIMTGISAQQPKAGDRVSNSGNFSVRKNKDNQN